MTSRTVLVCALLLVLALPASARISVDEDLDWGIGQTLQAHASASGAGGGGSSRGGLTSGYDLDGGGFFLKSDDGDFKLVVGGRFQGRFTGLALDEGDDEASFSIRRARVYFWGNVFREELKYLLQLASDDWGGGSRDFEVLDAWLKYSHSDAFGIKFGQFKLPYSRQKLTSSGKSQLVDRALATEEFMPEPLFRDRGVQLSGGFSENRMQWAFAITNGSGPNQQNTDTKFQYTGRIAANLSGNYGYSEGDLQHRDEIASSLGFAFNYRSDETATDDLNTWLLNLDGGFKLRGLSVQGEWFWRRQDLEIAPAEDTDEEISVVEMDTNGAYIQGGYFVMPEQLEIAGRWSRNFYEGSDNDLSEYSVGFGYFWMGHRLKLQADYSRLDRQASDADANRFRAQAQLWF